MTADSVRDLLTHAGEVEQFVRHRSVSTDKGRARCIAKEVTTGVRLDRDKLAKVRRLKDRRQPLFISVLSTLD
jgi:hypothetical protein